MLLAARGDKAQASAEFQKALDLAPGLTEAHRAVAHLAADSHDWPTAIREFQPVVTGDAAAHYDLAAALKARGQVEEAAHELQIAQRLSPARPVLH